jgi:hypothetical protein
MCSTPGTEAVAVSWRVPHLLALGLCLVALGLSAPRAALAQEHTPTPSANELWHDYPLDQSQPGPSRSATPSPRRTAPAANRSPAAEESGSDVPVAVMLVVVAVLAAAGALLVLRRRGRRGGAAMPVTPVPAAPGLGVPGSLENRVEFTPAEPGPRRSHASQPPSHHAQRRAGVRPPDTARRWTAEIEWHRSDEDSRFCVVARDPEARGVTVIAQSEPLDWPPADPDAVQALVGAADALTEALVSAGWTPLPPGTAWFGRRFEWKPVATSDDSAPPTPAPTASAAPTGRFRNEPWPRGTETLERCEIEWRSGHARSRFEAVAYNAHRHSSRVIGASAPPTWMVTGDADTNSAEFRDEARNLAAALESAGWERLGRGAHWYSERFVWRGEDEPPDHVEPAPVKARQSPAAAMPLNLSLRLAVLLTVAAFVVPVGVWAVHRTGDPQTIGSLAEHRDRASAPSPRPSRQAALTLPAAAPLPPLRVPARPRPPAPTPAAAPAAPVVTPSPTVQPAPTPTGQPPPAPTAQPAPPPPPPPASTPAPQKFDSGSGSGEFDTSGGP